MSTGPWKLLRFFFRVAARAILLWVFLAIVWVALPSPSREGSHASNYSTAVLRSGKVLTRVYGSDRWHTRLNHREGMALDYKLDIQDLTLSISGSDKPLPILNETPGQDLSKGITQDIDAVARIGDTDGANAPWFRFSDAVLLYWWIHKENLNITLTAQWSREEEDGSLHRLDLRADYELLLSLTIQGNDRKTVTAIMPTARITSSPSMTYPIRVAIIHVIAPTTVFVNDIFGSVIGMVSTSVLTAISIIFGVTLYGFMLLAVFFSLWRCLGGPSFETTVTRIQDRLETYDENERYRFLRIDTMRERLEWLKHSRRVERALDVCRHGWHPERQREIERRAEEETDVEKGSKLTSLPGGGS